jgi:formate--tetrahydrofolate ligase
LKYHGGKAREELSNEDLEALTKGLPNLVRHIENLQSFGVPVVVAVNKFIHDTDEEVQLIIDQCNTLNVPVSMAEGWEKGGEGSIELAEKVAAAADEFDGKYKPLYDWNDSIENKILKVSQTIYKAKNVEYSQEAFDKIRKIEKLEMDKLPICIAKTQSSFSDDAKKIGSPEGFTLHVRNIEIAAGAGFLIPLTGKMLRMPGLPAVPAAEGIDIDENDNVVGLS